jgi:ribosome-associated translation inhibitor RaiA
MGADFVCSACPLPEVTDKIREEVNKRISHIERHTVHNLLETYHHDWDEEVRDRIDERFGEEHLFKLDDIKNSFKKEIAQELIKEALEEVIYSQGRRDTGHMFLEHRWWVISGGMSWGDEPTEAMRYIDIIEESGILLGLNYKK